MLDQCILTLWVVTINVCSVVPALITTGGYGNARKKRDIPDISDIIGWEIQSWIYKCVLNVTRPTILLGNPIICVCSCDIWICVRVWQLLCAVWAELTDWRMSAQCGSSHTVDAVSKTGPPGVCGMSASSSCCWTQTLHWRWRGGGWGQVRQRKGYLFIYKKKAYC